MQKNFETSLRDLINSLQLAKIYPREHPQCRNALDKAYESLQHLLQGKEEIVVGIVGDELAFEKEIFLDLSRAVKPLIQFLKERGVERIVFRRGVRREELLEFIVFLITPKEDIGNNAQHYLLLKGVENIFVSKIRLSSSSSEEVRKSVRYLNLYHGSLDAISKSMNAVLNSQALDYIDLKYAFTNITEKLFGDYKDFLKLTTLKKHDVSTFVHMLDVAILAMYLSYRMNFRKEEIYSIGIAALFHDIGKIYISRKVIDKPDKLTDEEFAMMKSHTVLGAEILLKYTDSLGILSPTVAFEHHLRYDVKGYPKLSFPHMPHQASLIVSVCDVYDALNQRRSYKNSYSPDMIYNLMLKEKGGLFDPEILERFFKVIGVWPIGAVVALSDQRVAVVEEVNEDDIFSPRVKILSPDSKEERIDLRERKQEIKVEHIVEGFDYKKNFS